MGTVCAPVSPRDSRSTLLIGTNVMFPGKPAPAYADPPDSETPWMEWTWPACVRRSVVVVVAQLIPMLPWPPSCRRWICPVPSSSPCVKPMGWLGRLPMGSMYCPLDVTIPEFWMWTIP
ncbi:hypothetical protein EYF80_057151 [Liparis tanakae]|uniref:Uncharacterized protein n=1 Tax=Liparis tanakae TaxID=230148 RepID=A0A4Z2EUS2_9TELE|nr:hypothetical protein EYF80_057151 [Liparis tanakae]